MAEWLIEEGIAERRALLVEGERVLAARVMWHGELAAGNRTSGKLTAKLKGTRRGVVLLDKGQEALVDHLPPQATEGQRLDLFITRASLAERGRLKRAQARVAGPDAPSPTPPGPKDASSGAFLPDAGRRCGMPLHQPASTSRAEKSSSASRRP